MTGDLFHSDGSRKYMTQDERTAFLAAAVQFPHDVRSFCHVLTYTGCRLAEALVLSADRVDLRASRLTFETLKKRTRGIYRTVPVPTALALESRDGLATCQSCDASRGHQGRAGQPEGAPAWLRCGGGAGPHPAQPRAAVVGPCPVVDDGHLCRGHRARGTGDCSSDVDLTPGEPTMQRRGGMLRVTSQAYCLW
jgi:integrase/recombinase XerD